MRWVKIKEKYHGKQRSSKQITLQFEQKKHKFTFILNTVEAKTKVDKLINIISEKHSCLGMKIDVK